MPNIFLGGKNIEAMLRADYKSFPGYLAATGPPGRSFQDDLLFCLAHGLRIRPRNMEKKIPTVHRPIDTVNTTRALVRKPA